MTDAGWSARGQCFVHGFARTDAAKRPQADEGLHPKRTAASGADPREGQYTAYDPSEGAQHGARGARRAKKGLGGYLLSRIAAVPSA